MNIFHQSVMELCFRFLDYESWSWNSKSWFWAWTSESWHQVSRYAVGLSTVSLQVSWFKTDWTTLHVLCSRIDHCQLW